MLPPVSLFFDFVQFEFSHAIGPHAGRYVVRPARGGDHIGGQPDEGFEAGDIDDVLLFDESGRRNVTGQSRTTGNADVLVIGVVEAEPARFNWGRSKKIAAATSGAAPATVPLLLATFVKATRPLPDRRQAQDLLDHLTVDLDEQKRRIDEGIVVLNKAIRAYRTAAGDPYVMEVSRRDARAVRLGFGSTDEVSEGRWTVAITIPEPNTGRSKRSARLRPGETTARILSGRTEVLEAEDLLLRTLLDLDHGRTRAAAVQAYGALELLKNELPEPEYTEREDQDVAVLAGRARELAAEGARGPLTPEQVSELESLLEAAELQINRWRYPAR